VKTERLYFLIKKEGDHEKRRAGQYWPTRYLIDTNLRGARAA